MQGSGIGLARSENKKRVCPVQSVQSVVSQLECTEYSASVRSVGTENAGRTGPRESVLSPAIAVPEDLFGKRMDCMIGTVHEGYICFRRESADGGGSGEVVRSTWLLGLGLGEFSYCTPGQQRLKHEFTRLRGAVRH